MPPRPILTDGSIKKWCSDFSDTSQAELCVRYALAFNTLDVGWLEENQKLAKTSPLYFGTIHKFNSMI